MKPNLAQKVVFNVGAQTVSKAVALVLSLLAIRVMTEYLGVAGYGNLAIILALIALLLTASEFGISTVLARELARSPEKADALGGALFRFRLISAAAVIGLAVVVTPLLPYGTEIKLGLLVALIGAFFQSIGRFPQTFFQVNLRMDLAGILEIFYRLIIVLLVVLVAGLNLGFYAVLGALSAAAFIWSVSSFLVSARFWNINVHAAAGASQPLKRDSFGLWLFTIFGLLHYQGDMLLLSLMRPPSDVAIYAIAFKFIEHSLILAGLVMGVIFPILVRRLSESGERAGEVIRKCSALLLVPGICMTLILVVMAPQLVGIIAPEEFAGAQQPLRILALALPAMFAATVYLHALVALNRQRALIGIVLSSLGLNVALCMYLIPHYSYTGAAWATVASELFAVVMAFAMARRAFAFGLDYRLLSRISLPAVFAAGAVAATPQLPRPAVAAGGVAVFLAGVLVTKVITRSDVRLVLGR